MVKLNHLSLSALNDKAVTTIHNFVGNIGVILRPLVNYVVQF